MAIAVAVACPVALTAGSIEHVSHVAVLRQSPAGSVVTVPFVGTGPPLLHEEPALCARRKQMQAHKKATKTPAELFHAASSKASGLA